MSTAPAFQASDALKPLPFDPAKLANLSERLIRSHWESNYGGSVKALAVVKKRDAFFQNVNWDRVAARLAAAGATKM